MTDALPEPMVQVEVREDSPLYGSPALKERVVDAALAGLLTRREVYDLFTAYGLKEA